MARFKTTVTAEIMLDADTAADAMAQAWGMMGREWDVKTKAAARFVQGRGWVKV